MNQDIDKELAALERDELNLLIRSGVKFDIEYTIRRRKEGLRGYLQKKEIIKIKESYEMHEPTLSVLDRLSSIWLEMGIDEAALSLGGTTTLIEAKQIAAENCKRMALIIAIAVLGEDYHITEIDAKGRVKRLNDDKELNRLADLFYHAIKPSKLLTLSNTVTSMSNLGDFIGSMRLMSGARTTQPRKESIE